MSFHGVPPYSRVYGFQLEWLPWHPRLADRQYVYRADPTVSVRSDKTSKRWTIYVAGPAGAQFPAGKPYKTMTQAMRAVRSRWGTA